MKTLNREQQAVLSAILAVAQRVHATPMEKKAAVETGLVEANLGNPSTGDADSAGWRQERASLYPDPTNIQHSAARFFAEARQRRGKYGTAGALAAAVQRPAAQYRGRYQERAADADALLQGIGGSAAPAAPTSDRTSSLLTTTTTGPDQAGYGQAMRKAALAQYLQHVRPNSVLLTSGAVSPSMPDPQAFTKQTATQQLVPGSKVAESGTPVDNIRKVIERANKIDSAHLPYKWGGGHGGKVNVNSLVPLDCSGAVSALIGVNPRVADQFKQWGTGGRDPSGKFTIYAKGTHVLAEINGHFWGTSASNPKGGAGWIPRSAITPQYLAGFTPRHAPGL